MNPVDPRSWVNFDRVHLLLVDDHPDDASVLAQIVSGLGIRQYVTASSVGHAERLVKEQDFNLLLINANLRLSNAYDYVSWLRRLDSAPNCYVPIILVAGHTPMASVERARDCGANVILAKPVSPRTMLERILWASKDNRTFVKCETYTGPDRRFRKDGTVPSGMRGRRYDDAS
jgi:CheY-like chemotaxis protein